MKIDTSLAQKKIAYLWILITSSVFVLLIVLSATGKFRDNTQQLWGWFLQNITPILSLIIGVMVVEARNKARTKVVDEFYFKLCIFLTVTYFALLLLTLLLVPLAQKHGGFSAIDFVIFSNIYLGPFQGFVTAGLGIFFVKGEESN